MTQRTILVVGGGIAGLVFAVAARRFGMNVEIVELDPKVVGVGIYLSGSTLRALDSIGLAHECVEKGWPAPSLRLFDETGRFIADNPMPRIASPDLPVSSAIPRHTFAAILRNSAENAGARLRTGLTVDHFEDNGQRVHTTFSDGSEGDYDVVVGADGIYSRVRDLIFDARPTPRYVGQGGWRFMTRRRPDVDSMVIFAGPHTKAGFIPLDKDWMYLLSTVTSTEKTWVDPLKTPELYFDVLKDFSAPLVMETRELLLSADPESVIWRPFEELLLQDCWHKGNIVLIGDAVHSMTPHLTSGGGMAIEDAVVLADMLGREGAVEPLLVSFTRQRIDRVRTIHDISLGICAEECAPNPSRERIYELTMRGYNALASPFMAAVH